MWMTQRGHACLCSCTGRLLVPKALNLVGVLHRQVVLASPSTLFHVISLGQNVGSNFLSSTKPYPNPKSRTTLLLREKIRTLKLRISAVAEDSTDRISSRILSEVGLSQGTEDLVNWREKKVSMAEVEAEEAKLHQKKRRVVIIAGPTAVGKTRLALALAKRLGGEIISADSVQVYKGLDVGSAKTPVREREGIPHHLIDIVESTEDYDAGRFYDDARAATEIVLAKGAVPILVGGTGMYLRWYMNGKVGAPKATKEVTVAVEEEVEKLQCEGGGWDAALAMLTDAGDLITGGNLARNDWYRLRRALEIIKLSGQPRGAFQILRSSGDENPDSDPDWDYDFQCYFLYQPRPDLYRRIDLRCEQMIEEGMLEEASWLLDSGLQPNTNSASRAIGYELAMKFLLECRASEGVTTEESFLMFLAAFQQASRNLVKKQLTWFRNIGHSERLFNWIDATQPLDAMVDMLANEYERPHEVPSELKASGTKEASYKEGKLLKVYQATNRIFLKNSEVCKNVLEWIQSTQRHKQAEDICNDSEAGVDSEVGVDSAQTLH